MCQVRRGAAGTPVTETAVDVSFVLKTRQTVPAGMNVTGDATG